MLLFLSLNTLKSQQIPLYNQYNFNRFIFNPALVGYKMKNSRLTFSHRKQWSGVAGAPNTTLISFEGAKNGSVGYGGYAYYDKSGYIYTSSMYGVYSYMATLFKDFRIGAGIGTGFNFLGLDPSIYNKYTENDNVVANNLGVESRFVFDMGILISYYGFDVGVSSPNILSGIINKSNNHDELYKTVRHYLFSLGYNLPLSMPFLGKFNSNVLLKPIILTRMLEGIPFSYEGQVMLDIEKLGWINMGAKNGISTTKPELTKGTYIGELDLFLGLGYTVSENVSIGYTYGTGVTSTLRGQGDNHEITLTYELGSSRKMKEMLKKELEDKEKEKLEYIDAMEKKMKKLQDSLSDQLRKDIIINQNEIIDLRKNLKEKNTGDGGVGFVEPKNLTGIKSSLEGSNIKETRSSMPSNVVGGSKGFYIVAGAFKFRDGAETRARRLGEKGLENSIFFSEEMQLYYVFLRKYDTYEEAVKMRGTNLNNKYNKKDFDDDPIWVKEIK